MEAHLEAAGEVGSSGQRGQEGKGPEADGLGGVGTEQMLAVGCSWCEAGGGRVWVEELLGGHPSGQVESRAAVPTRHVGAGAAGDEEAEGGGGQAA